MTVLKEHPNAKGLSKSLITPYLGTSIETGILTVSFEANLTNLYPFNFFLRTQSEQKKNFAEGFKKQQLEGS